MIALYQIYDAWQAQIASSQQVAELPQFKRDEPVVLPVMNNPAGKEDDEAITQTGQHVPAPHEAPGPEVERPDRAEGVQEPYQLRNFEISLWKRLSNGIGVYTVLHFESLDRLSQPVEAWCVLQRRRPDGEARDEIVLGRQRAAAPPAFSQVSPAAAAVFDMTAGRIEAAARSNCQFFSEDLFAEGQPLSGARISDGTRSK